MTHQRVSRPQMNCSPSFQFPDEPTELDAYQQMLATDRLLEYAEISLRTVCDLIRTSSSRVGVVHSRKGVPFNSSVPTNRRDTP